MKILRSNLQKMKLRLPTLTPNSINIKAFVVCISLTLLLLFLGISLVYKPNRFKIQKSARKFLGFERHSPKFCEQLVRRESINWNYFYYYKNPASEQELIWCKVPKAGSTTLTKLFLRLAGSKNYGNTTRVHKLLRDFYPRLPNNLMWNKMKMTKTFMVVRDPFERILSAYRDKLENYERDLMYRDGYYHEHYGRYMVKGTKGRNGTSRSQRNLTHPTDVSLTSETPRLNVSLRREPTWKEFVQYLIRTSVARFDEHWMPITKLCSPCTVEYDFIVKMENFDEDIKIPLRSGGITAMDLGRNHMTGTANKRLIEKYFKKLTTTEVKKLYIKYKRDFLLFGYTPFKYFRMVNQKANSKQVSTTTNITKSTGEQFISKNSN